MNIEESIVIKVETIIPTENKHKYYKREHPEAQVANITPIALYRGDEWGGSLVQVTTYGAQPFSLIMLGDLYLDSYPELAHGVSSF